MIANYHTHTYRCGHARGEDRAYVEQAIAKGLKVLGFADHTYYPGPRRERMTAQLFEDYVDSVNSLKKEYASDIEIHLGVEVEYYPAFFHGLVDILEHYSFEYMILGQHYLGNEDDEPFVKKIANDPVGLDRYCEQVKEGMATGLFTYLAHPDLIQDMGQPLLYAEKMREVCRTANRYNMPLELNLLGIYAGIHYPNENFWKIAAEEGCRVILGADAHDPEFVRPEKELQRAMEIVDKYQLNLIDTVELRRPF